MNNGTYGKTMESVKNRINAKPVNDVYIRINLYITQNSTMYQVQISKDKERFDFSNYSTKSKYYDNSKKLVIGWQNE